MAITREIAAIAAKVEGSVGLNAHQHCQIVLPGSLRRCTRHCFLAAHSRRMTTHADVAWLLSTSCLPKKPSLTNLRSAGCSCPSALHGERNLMRPRGDLRWSSLRRHLN
jgi:hypothetical protein